MAAEGQNGSKMLDEMPEYRIFELLKKYHYTLTTAESATGGMIASTLINVPGISAFFTEGYVTYSNEAKVKMIHVKPETIERYGVVSAETAADMAVSAARTADTDAALSVTGVAGPDGGTRECPVGLVYIGCCLHGRVVTERHLFAGDRMQVRKSATDAALHLLARTIIAGTARSLPLKAPEGMDTRPTTDRIKETLFNIIQDEVPGAYFLDLFAGSGQMGLEAVSRGARYAVFVDNGKKPAACIEENIRFTKFEHQTKLYPTEVLSALRAMEGKYQFDLIFMDPPYRKGMEQEVLRYLAGSSLLKEDTVLIVEAALDTDFSYLDEYGMTLSRLKMYKTNEHAFIRRK